MNAQERCRLTVAFEPTDRLPRYLPALSCDVASELLGRPTLCGTGSLHCAEARAWANGDRAHAEFEAKLSEDLIAVHRHLGIDVFREPWRMTAKPARMIDENTFVYGDPAGEHAVYQYDPDSADFGVVRQQRDPSVGPEERLRRSLAQALALAADASTSVARGLRAQVQRWRQVGQEFFFASSGGGISAGLDEDAMITLASEPDLVAQRCLAQSRLARELVNQILAAGMPGVLLGGGDLAGADGVIYGPNAFRNVVFPAYRELLDHCNAVGMHYVFRSDGNLWQITDLLFDEAGCPGYGETDRECDMTVARLRQRYPRLVIWGNVPSGLLHHGTADAVRVVARQVRDECQGRGCFQGCSNAIVKGTPPANVEALFDCC
jgi:hypothetical protein